jgi:DNA-binding MarR family transcriptional regulator
MHTVFFGLKRAHHSVLRISRDALAKIGLTAARFDLLYATMANGGAAPQRTLRRLLGVGRTTVSRMLASLEQLGLLKRSVDSLDRRQKRVELTTEGRRLIASAHRRFTRSGWAQLALDTALCGRWQSDGWCNSAECIKTTALIDGLLNSIRHAFMDSATLCYPWSPDDFDDPWEDIVAQDEGEGPSYPESLVS